MSGNLRMSTSGIVQWSTLTSEILTMKTVSRPSQKGRQDYSDYEHAFLSEINTKIIIVSDII